MGSQQAKIEYDQAVQKQKDYVLRMATGLPT